MNVLFTDSITVYNCYRDPDAGNEVWNRSVINGVQWRHNKSEVSITHGVQTENKVECSTIDFQRAYGNKPYIPPHEYRKLAAEEAKRFWTLDAKSGKDIIILGEVDKEISKQYRASELQKDYQYAVTVTSVSDNRSKRLKHIKVVGK